MAKLTKRVVDKLKPGEREAFVWDRAKGRSRRFALGLHGVSSASLSASESDSGVLSPVAALVPA